MIADIESVTRVKYNKELFYQTSPVVWILVVMVSWYHLRQV